MRKIILTTFFSSLLLLAGCESKEPENRRQSKQQLILYCGAGIRPPANELIKTFADKYDIEIVPDYAGSEVLLSKIKLTRRGDLYMPGDKHYVEQAESEGMILSKRTVCYWVPVILVQKGNPKKIGKLEDLLKPQLKIGLGDRNACAIGRITKQILEKNNISLNDLGENLIYQSLTVNELGMQIQAGTLDAVIVWDAVAKYYSDYGDDVPITTDENIISTVDIGVLKSTRHRRLAEKFLEFVSSEEGQRIFEKYNYSTQPPE